MNVSISDTFRSRLLDRRARLVATIDEVTEKADLRELLNQVDAALERFSAGTYGSCETCRDPIEADRLRVNPLTQYCSSHVTSEERVAVVEDHRDEALQASFHALEPVALRHAFEMGGDFSDLFGELPRDRAAGAPATRLPARSFRQRVVDAVNASLHVFLHKKDHQSELDKDFFRASSIQSNLLPKCGLCLDGWQTYYNYTPAGKVGGDYCDLVKSKTSDDFFFFSGDAVGKGIAGSMIAAQLHAVFRTLVSLELSLKEMFERANRLFCESMAPDYYATVVCGRASSNGNLEIVNAGHPSPFILRSGEAIPLPATGLPLGLFYTSTYDVAKIQLGPGEGLVCYTDGFTEARNRLDAEYGPERFASFVAQRSHLTPEELVQACVDELTEFTSNASPSDDRTVMALRHLQAFASQGDVEAMQERGAMGQR